MNRALFVLTILLMPAGYGLGRLDGAMQTQNAIDAIHVARNDHDATMRKLGVCKWAKIMADDLRCKSELP